MDIHCIACAHNVLARFSERSFIIDAVTLQVQRSHGDTWEFRDAD